MAAEPRHLRGCHGRRLPESLHGDGAAHRARQHPAQHRVQRGVDPRSARAPGPLRPSLRGRPAGGGGRVDRVREAEGRGAARQRGRLVDDRRQLERGGQAGAHHRPLQRHRPRVPAVVRPDRRGRVPGAGAAVTRGRPAAMARMASARPR